MVYGRDVAFHPKCEIGGWTLILSKDMGVLDACERKVVRSGLILSLNTLLLFTSLLFKVLFL